MVTIIFPFYLIIIAASIIIASHYSYRILRLTFTRSLPVLATLFLLSYTGVLRTVLTVLFSYSTITHLPSGHQQVVWSIDASVPLFGLKFTILFITCVLFFLLLVLFNITLLLPKILLHLKIIKTCIKSLLSAFQSSYKDKYFYWVTILIITRNLFIIFRLFQVKLRLVLSTVVLVFFTAYQGYNHPYKNKLVNIQHLVPLINLTIMYAVSYLNISNSFAIITNITIGLAFIQFWIIVWYHFFTYTCRSHNRVTVVLRSMKERVLKLISQKNSPHTYNIHYNEYQDTELLE